jgi:hypothetical protein
MQIKFQHWGELSSLGGGKNLIRDKKNQMGKVKFKNFCIPKSEHQTFSFVFIKQAKVGI